MFPCIHPYGFQWFLQVINLQQSLFSSTSEFESIFSLWLFSLEYFTHKDISMDKRLFFLRIGLLWINPVLQRHILSSTTVSETGGFLSLQVQDGINLLFHSMSNHNILGMTISVRIYVLTFKLVQYNVLIELLDPKPFLLVVICQIHTDASKTCTIFIK